MERIISACPILEKVQYIMDTIHDGLCAELRFNIRKEMGVKLDNEQLQDDVPKLVETVHEGKVTMLWNQQVWTDRTIPNNKPDIVVRDNKQGTCTLADVAITRGRNVIKYNT